MSDSLETQKSTGESPIASGRIWRRQDDPHRRAAVDLMRAGMAGPSEIAILTGYSQQKLQYWQRAAGIDYRAARAAWLAKAWRRLTAT